MKRLLLWSLSFFLAVFLQAENLLVNGNFEKGTVGWETPSWIKNTIPPAADQVVNAGGGRTSLRMQGRKGANVIVFHRFVMPPGTRYLKVSLKAKTCDLGKTYAVAFADFQNHPIPVGRISTYKQSANKKETPWFTCEELIMVPEKAGPMGKYYLKLAPGATGTVWFDDVQIEALDKVRKTAGALPVRPRPEKVTKKQEDLRFTGLKSSSESILLDAWDRITWLRDTAEFSSGKSDRIVFDIRSGQRALVQQRIMSIERNCEGAFCFSAWFKNPAGIFPVMNVTIYPVFTVHRKTVSFSACATGAVKDGYREYACRFIAPPQTGEIRPMIGISGASSVSGQVDIRDIALRPLIDRKNEVILYAAGNDGRWGMFYTGEIPFADLKFKNSSDQEYVLHLDGSMRDITGREIRKFQRVLKLPSRDISSHKVLFPHPEKQGFFSVHFSWKDPSGKAGRTICSFVSLPPEEDKGDPLFGITFMARNAEIAEAMKRMGCGTKGLFIIRNQVENADGDFDWKTVDRELEALEKTGIQVIGGLEIATLNIPFRFLKEVNDRKKQGLYPFSEAYFAHAIRFEEAVFRRYGKRIKKWAVIGEIDLLKHRNSYEYSHYIRRVKDCSRTLKRVIPDGVLSGIGCSGGDGRSIPRYPVLRDLWYKQGLHGFLDGLGIDQYTSPLTFGPGYEAANSETGQIREMMQEALKIARSKGQDKRISIDEKGFKIVQSLPVDSPYAVRMAEIIAREFITLKSIPEVEHYLYFMWKRWRAGEEFDWGLWLDRFPRPGAAAYAATARIVGNSRFLCRQDLHVDIPCYVFEKNHQRLAALWLGGTARGKASVSLPVPENPVLMDMEGNRLAPQFRNGRIHLTLTSAPVYIGTSVSFEKFQKILSEASAELPSVALEMIPRKSDCLEVILKNLVSGSVSGTLAMENRFTSWRKPYVISAGGLKKMQIPLKNRDAGSLSGFVFKLENITSAGQVFYHEDRFVLHGIPRVSSAGEVAKVKPQAVLENGGLYLNIPDFILKNVWKGPSDCSAVLRMGYDAENLYLHIRVRDDIHANRHFSEDMLWAGDAVQFAFDSLLDAREKRFLNQKGLFGDDHFFTMALGGGKERLFCHQSGCQADWAGCIPGIIRNEQDKTTTYELALPWARLKPLRQNQKEFFAFNFIVMDSDNPMKAPVYWMQLTPGIAGGQKPELFHLFTLEP